LGVSDGGPLSAEVADYSASFAETQAKMQHLYQLISEPSNRAAEPSIKRKAISSS
jgi:hypothetical protein